jgi:hypothetical protein
MGQRSDGLTRWNAVEPGSLRADVSQESTFAGSPEPANQQQRA